MWNENMIIKLSKMQKKIIASAVSLLKPEGVLVYSTCTHAPEENEENVSFAVEKLGMQVQSISLPVKTRCGISEWQGASFSEEIKNCCRVYPQDNDTEGFFLAKLKFKEAE
jgi:tRNA (cytosine49-C5)-methyltransferase